MGLGLSDQDVRSVVEILTPFDQDLRGVPYPVCPLSYFGWQAHAAVEMPPNALGEIPPTLRTHVRAAPERICRELCHVKVGAAGQTVRDRVIRAIDEEQGSLFGCQALSPSAVQMRQATGGRLDDIGQGDRPRALLAPYLHGDNLCSTFGARGET